MSESRSFGPARRSPAALRMTAAAALGRFELQECDDCGCVQYPPREACQRCLSAALAWNLQAGTGELISQTTLFHSHDAHFRERLPWRVGLVRLDAGPVVIAHLHAGVLPAPGRVQVVVRLDKTGHAALVAVADAGDIDLIADRQLSEMTWDTKGRRVLVTDGTTALGGALTRQLLQCGARHVWAGYPGEPASKPPGGSEFSSGLECVALDVTDESSVGRAATQLGSQVDVLINTAEFRAGDGAIESAQEEMDVNCLGLQRLSAHFGPLMRARTDAAGAVAWVNVLSVCACSGAAALSTYSASKVAALSLSQGLRATMRTSGIAVMNVFPGPMDPELLAGAITTALRDTVEDLYPGEVAQQWLSAWQENSKVMERQLALRP